MAETEIFDLEELGGTGEIDNHCVVGKILSKKPPNLIAVSNILKGAWKTRADFSITPWNNNIFLFRFEEIEDRNTIIKEGPWSVMNNLLVLKPLTSGEVISAIEFDSCPFWVQIHGLPVDKMSRANAETIGRRFGNLVAVEAFTEGLLLHRSFLRVRVEIELSQPLPRGFWLRKKTEEGRDLWISYKYEKLSDYCYACGRIGHENKDCKYVSREEGMASGYGPDLKTGKARASFLPPGNFRREVDAAKIQMETLPKRRPEILTGDKEARVMNMPIEQMEIPNSRQDRTKMGMKVPHSLDLVGVRDSPGGSIAPSPGTHSSTTPIFKSLLSPQLTPLPSNHFSQNIFSSNPLTSHLGPYSLTKPNPIPTPIPSPTHILTPGPFQTIKPTAETKPLYFVTEPFDSPDNNQKPIDSLPISGPDAVIIEDISQSPSPPRESQLISTDLTLSTVFGSLSLKRKALLDPEDLNLTKTKQLKIVEPKPNPFLPRNPHLPELPAKHPNALSILDQGVVLEVNILQSNDIFIPNLDGSAVLDGCSNQKAVVAGLKQPQAPW